MKQSYSNKIQFNQNIEYFMIHLMLDNIKLETILLYRNNNNIFMSAAINTE